MEPTTVTSMSGAEWIRIAAILGASFAMGIGTIGSALGQGYSAGKACEAIAKRPDYANQITRTMLMGQAIAESAVIYALVIALILIFVVK